MRYTSQVLTATLLLGGTAFGQQNTQGELLPAPTGTFGGVYHASTGVWVYGPAPEGPPIGDVLYNHSTTIGFYVNQSDGNTTVWEGRVPSLSSPTPVGTQNSYAVTGLEFEYITSELDVASGGPGAHFLIGLVDKRGKICTGLGENAPATYLVDVVGAPASSVAGQLSGHTVTIDVSGLGICLSGDGEGVYDGGAASEGSDGFAYTIRFLDAVSGGAGWRATDQSLAGDNTVFTTGGIGPGSGLGRSLLAFYQEGDGSSPEACFNTQSGQFYANLKIFGNADGIECTGCPGDDRYEALGNDDCGSALQLNNAASVENLTANGPDKDYFRVTVADGQRLDVDILFSHAQGDLDMRLWNEDCMTLLRHSNSGTDNESTSWVNASGVAADVTIEVFTNSSGGSAGCADYDMEISNEPILGANYCTANLNSLGLLGTISASGSDVAADNDVTLAAENLPTGAFGFFLTSTTQGFTANPGGSGGNLCLAGTIGRYVGPGQVLLSGASGTFSLALDLTMTPTPTGLVSVATGETWNFQAWHRDSVAGMATSNFTDGVSVTFQ